MIHFGGRVTGGRGGDRVPGPCGSSKFGDADLEYQRRPLTSPPGGRSGGGVVEIPIKNYRFFIGYGHPCHLAQSGSLEQTIGMFIYPSSTSKKYGFYRFLKDLHPAGVAEPWRSLNN